MFSGTYLSGIIDILSTNITDTLAWKAMSLLYDNVMLPIGMALVVLYFLLELMDKVTQELVSIEIFLKMFLKLFIAVFLIQNGLNILDGLLSVGLSLIGSLIVTIQSTDFAVGEDIVTAFQQEVENASFFTQIVMCIELLIPKVIMFIIEIAVQVICWGRIIELCVRAMLSPIPIADVFADGMRSNGVRYLKKYAGVCVQGAVILAIAAVMYTLQLTMLPDMDDVSWSSFSMFTIKYIIIAASSLFMIVKSQTWANDLFGV